MTDNQKQNEGGHYAWGASVANTWRSCHGSINLAHANKAKGMIPDETPDANRDEGTAAHEWAEKALVGEIQDHEIPPNFYEHLEGYLAFTRNLAETVGGGECLVMNEQKVPYWYNDSQSGTLDYGVVAEDASEIAIADLKYGAGQYVTADENNQGAIYAISLIKKLEDDGYKFNDDTKVTVYIYQPRHRSFTGYPESWVTTYRELMDIAIDIEADYTTSKTASTEDLTPSEKACFFCPANTCCSKRVADAHEGVPMELNMTVPASQDELQLPELHAIDSATRLAVFKNHAKITKWMKDLNEDTLAHEMQGNHMVGFKAVLGNDGNRTWGDNESEVEKLLRKIPAADRYKPRRVLSPAQAEKTLKKMGKSLDEQSTKFKNRWDELIHRKAGAPKLALESDPRQSLTTGAACFDDVSDDMVSDEDCF